MRNSSGAQILLYVADLGDRASAYSEEAAIIALLLGLAAAAVWASGLLGTKAP